MAGLHEELTLRFSTEAMISGIHLAKNKINDQLHNCGDSLVVAGSPKKMRIHIHTDHPAEVFLKMSRFGDITYQKVDDMVFQNEIMQNRKSDIAVLTDSTCDLPQDILERYQIHMIPLSVHFGDSFYLDRITMNPQQFYQMVQRSEERPTTSQPTIKEFQNKFEYLSSHYSATLGVFLSEKLSGTFQNSVNSSSEISNRTKKPAYLFNSRNLSAALGLVVLRIARALEEGMIMDEILPKIDTWINKSFMRVTIPSLDYISKSGRISPFKGLVARLLKLKPFIAIDAEGKSEIIGKSLTESGTHKMMISHIRKMLRKNEIWEYAITHAENLDVANYYAGELEKMTGKKPLFVDHVSPVVVANTGTGVVGVSFMLK